MLIASHDQKQWSTGTTIDFLSSCKRSRQQVSIARVRALWAYLNRLPRTCIDREELFMVDFSTMFARPIYGTRPRNVHRWLTTDGRFYGLCLFSGLSKMAEFLYQPRGPSLGPMFWLRASRVCKQPNSWGWSYVRCVSHETNRLFVLQLVAHLFQVILKPLLISLPPNGLDTHISLE